MSFVRSWPLAIAIAASPFVPLRSAFASASLPGTCEISTVAVQQVLGVSGPDKYTGPILAGEACSWKTNDPNCFLRVLSVRQHVTDEDLATVNGLLAKVKPIDRAPKALGKKAFFVHTDLGLSAAIAIERVYVPLVGRSWVEVTLSGRLGPDGSRELLVTAAKAVPRRGSPSS